MSSRPVIVTAEVSVIIRRDGGHTSITERKELRYPPATTEAGAAEQAVNEVSALVLGRIQ